MLQVLISLVRCASLEMCPSDQAIMDAVKTIDETETFALAQTPGYEQALIVTAAITGVSDVLCGDPVPAQIPTVICRYTVHYRTHDSYQIARLERGDRWRIAEVLAVPRQRKGLAEEEVLEILP